MKRGVLVLLGLIGIGVITAIIFAAVRSGGSTTTVDKTLRVWSPFNERKIYEQISNDFFESHPDTKIEFKYIESKDAKDYEAKVVNAIADGAGPDVWIVRSDWIPKHAPKSLPAASSKDVDPIAVAKTKIVPALVDLNVYDKKLYGVPMAADSLVIIYNYDFYNAALTQANEQGKQVLSSVPKYWSDLRDQSAIVTKKAGANITRSAISLGTVDTVYAPVDALALFLNQAGVNILTPDGKDVAFHLPLFEQGKPRFSATDALEFYTSFARTDQANYSWNDTLGQGIDAFINQKTGALIGYYSTLGQIVERKPGFEIRVSPMVQRAEKVARVDFAGTWSHIVNSETKKSTVAWDYISYLANPVPMAGYSNQAGRLSPLIDENLIDSQVSTGLFEVADSKEIVLSQFYYARQFIKPEWQQVDQILQDAIRQTSLLGKSSQNSVDTAAERFKVFVKK